MTTAKLRISTRDKTGITHLVSGILAKLDIDIVVMEVTPGEVHVRLALESAQQVTEVKTHLLQLPEVLEVASADYLPSEIQRQNLLAIVNSLGEIIIACDVLGNIILHNRAAIRFFGRLRLQQSLMQVLGTTNKKIVRQILAGQNLQSEDIWLETEEERQHFYLSTRSIYDEENLLIGALLTLVVSTEMRKLAFRLHAPQLNTFAAIKTQSSVMRAAIEQARQAAELDVPILLRGESGTGKELFARAIHAQSTRDEKPFVPLNCAAIPDTLIESELFGHEPGAFTGAGSRQKVGLLEVADGGSLFLDEIGELPLPLQAKLLRVLQDGEIRRLGGHRTIKVDFRIIAATNRNLEKMLEHQQFRSDLYYRLNVVPISIPPLRHRDNDIPLLVRDILARIADKNKYRVSDRFIAALQKHKWPGNVRELENVIQRSLSFAGQSGELKVEDLHIDSEIPRPEYPDENTIRVGRIVPLTDFRRQAERAMLHFAMQKEKSTRKLASLLGVSHMTIANKLRDYKCKQD
jgi:TyrR family helix-turn-helix protein